MRLKSKEDESLGLHESGIESGGQSTNLQPTSNELKNDQIRSTVGVSTSTMQLANQTSSSSPTGQGKAPMTELSFLIDLLLNHKLAKNTKDAIALRIKEVENNLPRSYTTNMTPYTSSCLPPAVSSPRIAHGVVQSASTAALLDKYPDLGPKGELPTSPVPTAQVAQTLAAAKAMQDRQDAIRIAQSGKEEKGRTSPRKF